MDERYKVFFKPSIYRISSYYLSLFGFEGTVDDIKELKEYMIGFRGGYPRMLQKRWPLPVGKMYGYRPADFDYALCNSVLEQFPEMMNSYRAYIQKSIYEGQGRLRQNYQARLLP